MKFELSDKITKEVSPGTLAVYKSHLNKLAKEDIKNASDIYVNRKRVIQIVKGFSSEKSKRRVFYSAIFYALSHLPNGAFKKDLYDAFQEEKDEATLEYKKKKEEEAKQEQGK
jgi:hypothetical protein